VLNTARSDAQLFTAPDGEGTLAAGVLLVGASPIAAHPAASWANGDPASDVLLAQDVFYRYEPKVSAALERRCR
jgi:hypothetical protein